MIDEIDKQVLKRIRLYRAYNKIIWKHLSLEKREEAKKKMLIDIRIEYAILYLNK